MNWGDVAVVWIACLALGPLVNHMLKRFDL